MPTRIRLSCRALLIIVSVRSNLSCDPGLPPAKSEPVLLVRVTSVQIISNVKKNIAMTVRSETGTRRTVYRSATSRGLAWSQVHRRVDQLSTTWKWWHCRRSRSSCTQSEIQQLERVHLSPCCVAWRLITSAHSQWTYKLSHYHKHSDTRKLRTYYYYYYYYKRIWLECHKIRWTARTLYNKKE